MNFVRFVKTPRVSQTPEGTQQPYSYFTTLPPCDRTLSTILTITSDFSPFPSSAPLLCSVVSPDGTVIARKEVDWTSESRELKLDFLLPNDVPSGKIVVRHLASGSATSNEVLADFLHGNGTHVVGIATATFPFDVDSKSGDTVYRRFMVPRGPLTFAEQAGETIIRHVWDAGILLASTLCSSSISMIPDELQGFVKKTFNPVPKNILELGTGVGVLGICIAAQYPRINVVVTDLPDARDLVEENILINVSPTSHIQRNVSFRPLDWEQRPFPPWTETDKFDVIVMADVTYNSSTFEALADTLEHLLRTGSKDAKVVCCAKRRHIEEEEFWKIVQQRGFVIQMRIVFAMDLTGNFRCSDTASDKEGEQLIDFITMSIPS